MTGLSQGSTTISFSFGDAEALDIDDPISREIDDTFWLIANGMVQNQRPMEVTDSTAAAVDELIGALRHAAPLVELLSLGHPSVQLKPESVDRGVWQSSLNLGQAPVTFVGILEMLDLRNGRFRIADDVGNRIVLRDVRSPHEAARHIDHRVRVTGRPAYAPDGEVKHLVDVQVAALQLPQEWEQPGPDVAALLKATPDPTAFGGLDLSDQEFDDFMAAIDA